MVRSMIAGVAGLKTHQSKLDVIGNNIANVNTWSFKAGSFNFQDSMYTNSLNSASGDVTAGSAGGRNPSQVGYGTTTSSITSVYTTGAPSPSSNPLDCMIDGTGLFLVGNMINGTFTSIEGSGLFLSRVGIFRPDNNGYLVDDQRSYVYGYALVEGTGIPEIPAKNAQYQYTGAGATFSSTANANGKYLVTIGGITVESTSDQPKNQVQDWIAKVAGKESFDTVQADGTAVHYGPDADGNYNTTTNLENPFKDYNVAYNNYNVADAATGAGTVNLTITKKTTGPDPSGGTGGTATSADKLAAAMAATAVPTGANPMQVKTIEEGNLREAPIDAEYATELSTLRIPIDPTTGARYDIQSYSISEDGIITGIDRDNRVISIGQLCLVSVENPNGLEKTNGYYYTIGDNAGRIEPTVPNGGPVGKIKGGMLEMANVDLANEFSNMITTQRGFQANSKIITVTDEMLQELVNMKR
ncbi:MAG: flagellar hook-basal body complex protein [Hespellia sp.]|nr:flagellar hook-basal body complex protein [Hespellia sp.]